MKYARYGLIAVLLSILVLPLSAWAANLQDLITFGENITAGEKVFTNFSGSLLSSGAHPSLLGEVLIEFVPGRNSLSVFPTHEPGTPSGFSGIGFLDLEVGFDVTVTAGHNAIAGIGVGIPFVSIPGVGFVSAAASARGAAASVFASGPFAEPLPTDVATLSSPATIIHVENRLSFGASLQPPIDDFLRFSHYEISFVQSASVPEPSTPWLLVFGAGVIAAIGHRVRRVQHLCR
jgi:hypothetical protein